MNTDMISYYRDRAKEYEKIYTKPERQSALLFTKQLLQETFANKDVLEIACGTGYWTEKIATTAKHITATDINDTVIEIAKSKNYSAANVQFQVADLFALRSHTYESLFGGFIWSHIKRQDVDAFINVSYRLVETGGTIVFMDNNYVEGSSLPVVEGDDFGNTYQVRALEDGTTHKIVKNFPTETFIRESLANKNVTDIQFISLPYYWILLYKTT